MQWLQNVCSGLAGLFAAQPRAPAQGSGEHFELRMVVRQGLREERAKPPEQRDPQRLLQLRIQGLQLGIEECEVRGLSAAPRGLSAAPRTAPGRLRRSPGGNLSTRPEQSARELGLSPCSLLLHSSGPPCWKAILVTGWPRPVRHTAVWAVATQDGGWLPLVQLGLNSTARGCGSYMKS